jgi:CDP-4-dehydro-6-deoxyglucose reductase, E1
MQTLPNQLRVPYALAVHNEEEKKRIVAVLDEHRTNMGKETAEFENRVKKYFGKKYAVMLNSGSSANLLAFEILNLPKGSEVITPLLTFSTTVSPLIKMGLVPVFVDVEKGKYIININEIEKLITKRTKAIMVPLLLGNVPDMEKLRKIARKYKLYLVEDSCDTFGATFNKKPTGSYSDITTTSFFGSHIITTGGNGGMIMMNNKAWANKAKVLRGWGRNSSLFGESENISKRFSTKIGDIPYDAKFIFSDIGYNFVPNEMCAAFGNVQLDKLSKFKKTREDNFTYLLSFFKQYENLFTLPIQDKNTNTQWIAFPLTIKRNAPFSRLQLVTYLEKNNIQTRPIFTGNILKQPGFRKIEHRISPNGYQVTNDIMKHGFLIGCHHGMKNEHLKKIEDVFSTFLGRYS